MSNTFRYNSQKAFVEYEWLNTHVKARDPKFGTAVANHLDELRSRLLRLMGAAADEDLESDLLAQELGLDPDASDSVPVLPEQPSHVKICRTSCTNRPTDSASL